MKFERTLRFEGDLRRLSLGDRETFVRVTLDEFVPAAERVVSEPGTRWPSSLRVRRVEAAPGVWEMTWSFSGPDGRATFEWVVLEGEPAIRWRRVGPHTVFRDP